jgi:pimeloyl-ACP methyl ester carboxylesterase
MAVETLAHAVDNGDGWRLGLYQTFAPRTLDRQRHPVLIVPGYGMNSYIFSYHPSGMSLEGYLVQHGFEVWRADLRAQGGSVRTAAGSGEQFTLQDLAFTDLGAVIDAVRERTKTQASVVDVAGASLGGTLMFMQAVMRDPHKLGTLIAIGSPVRWVTANPVLRAVARVPWLVGKVAIRGARPFSEIALPLLAKHTPALLSMYLNPSITDVSAAHDLVRTVENPNRHINRQIVEWVAARDLVVDGVNLSQGLHDVRNPLLCIAASHDGIVPRATAEFAYGAVSSPHKKLLVVGDATAAMAHADLFISRLAHERVFAPMLSWLRHGGHEPNAEVKLD